MKARKAKKKVGKANSITTPVKSEMADINTVDELLGFEEDAGVDEAGSSGEDSGDTRGGARHEDELRALEEKDPEFYKFLLEEDPTVLDFRSGDDEVNAEDREEREKKKKYMLTLERYRFHQDNAKSSFKSFKFVLRSYHAAVNNLRSNDGEGEDTVKSKTWISVDDKETFSQVIEWSTENILGLFQHYAQVFSTKQKKQMRRVDPGIRLTDVSRSHGWLYVKQLLKKFWGSTLFLVQTLKAAEMLEFVLRVYSTPDAMAWLWPFKRLHDQYFKHCCSLWSAPWPQSVRLHAFLFLRESIAMSLRWPTFKKKKLVLPPEAETLARRVLMEFAKPTFKKYTWRSLNSDRFKENCLVELLRLDDAMAYRLGYLGIRKLVTISRGARVAKPLMGDKQKAKAFLKQEKKDGEEGTASICHRR